MKICIKLREKKVEYVGRHRRLEPLSTELIEGNPLDQSFRDLLNRAARERYLPPPFTQNRDRDND